MRFTKTLRRRETRRSDEPTRGLISFPVPPPTVATGPVSMRLERRPVIDGPPLWIRRTPGGNWMWQLERARGDVADSGLAPTWSAALALGLAALDTATHRAVHRMGTR